MRLDTPTVPAAAVPSPTAMAPSIAVTARAPRHSPDDTGPALSASS